MDRETHEKLENFCKKARERTGKFVSKARVAREALVERLLSEEFSEKFSNLAQEFLGLPKLVLEAQSPIPPSWKLGSGGPELLEPVSTGIRPDAEAGFRFRLGEELVKEHMDAKKGEPVRCRISVEAKDREIFSREISIELEGGPEEEGQKDRVVPIPKELVAEYQGMTLTWTLQICFYRIHRVTEEPVEMRLRESARFYVVPQTRLLENEFLSRCFQALLLVRVGLYDEAEELCDKARELFPDEELPDAIKALIYRRRAYGITGAPGEEPLPEPIEPFVEVFDHYQRKIGLKGGESG